MRSKGPRRIAFIVLAALALLGTLLLLPRLVGRFCANVGMVLFYKVALDGTSLAAHYPPDVPPDSLHPIDGWLAAARTWAGDDAVVQRAVGRLALYAGDARLSWQTLQPLQAQAGQDPLLYVDLLAALSASAPAEEVLTWVEDNPPPVAASLVSDTLFLAYVQAGVRSSAATRTQMLEEARRMRPFDLCVNYLLWSDAQQGGDPSAAQLYQQALGGFPLEAVIPTDERVAERTFETIPRLWDDGCWDRATLLNVVAYLVWQYPEKAGVEGLLDHLRANHPDEADWAFYRGELHQRRGEWEKARSDYLQALALDPLWAEAYLRLGMIAEAQAGTPGAVARPLWEEAAEWYRAYHLRAPQDLLGLKRLAAVLVMLGEAEGRDLEQELGHQTEARRIAAELLGIDPEGVDLGPNLLAGGDFEEWADSRPTNWAWSAMFNQAPFANAAFAGGPDPLLCFGGRSAARVDGLWVGPKVTSAARAGFWYWRQNPPAGAIPAEKETSYVLSFYYRTDRVPDDKATVWVSSAPGVLWAGDRGLPATDLGWYRVVAVGWSGTDKEATIRPLLRTLAPGTVMFDDIGLWVLDLPTAIPMEQPRFAVIRGDY